MSKFINFLTAIVLIVTLAPASLAHASTTKRDVLKITSAIVETNRQKVIGKVTVCNTEAKRTRFVLEAKNETINSLYKRKLSIPGTQCKTYKLNFTKNFAEMSNVDDEIHFITKSTTGSNSFKKNILSKSYSTIVKEGNRNISGCGDENGKDDIYNNCVNDFIYHEPTGLRIKIKNVDYKYVEILVTHVRWGGVKKFRIYKNRSKTVSTKNYKNTKVEISNLVGERTHDLFLGLKSK